MIESFLRFAQYEKRYSEHTLKSYENDLNQLENFIEDHIEIQDLSHHDIRSWIIHLSESGTSARSINRKLATLKSFYKFLLSREIIGKNPTERLKPLKTESKLPQFIKESEITQLLDHLEFENSFEGKRDQLIIELLYGSGIRLSELIGLKISQINFYDHSIKVLGKRNKERVIPINENLVKYIKNYITVRDTMTTDKSLDFLILTTEGAPAYPMLVYRVVKKYLSLITTQRKKSPHVLRHTFATHLLNKGADLNSVKDLLGHTSLAATQVYTHNSLEKLKSVFEQAHPKA
jgi:integrase/recombinase XerC